MTHEKHPTVPFEFERRHDKESAFRGRAMRDSLRRRRSIRECSSDPVPRFLIEIDEDHDAWVDRWEHYDAAGVLEKFANLAGYTITKTYTAAFIWSVEGTVKPP